MPRPTMVHTGPPGGPVGRKGPGTVSGGAEDYRGVLPQTEEERTWTLYEVRPYCCAPWLCR